MSSKQTSLITRTARLSAGLTVLALAAGCGLFGGDDGAGGGDKGAGATPGAGASTGAAASPVPKPKPGGPFTAAQLAQATRAKLPQLRLAYQPSQGAYGTLQAADVAVDGQDVPAGVTISPAKCKAAIWAGPSKREYAKSPAAFQLYLATEGDAAAGTGAAVQNVLIDSAGKDPKAALGRRVSGCGRVRVSAEGRTTTLTSRRPPELGTAGRATVLTDGSNKETWIVAYAGNGYIGNVVVQSPDDAAQVEAIVTQAYRQARRVLG